MKSTIKKLNFNGIKIPTINIDGNWWIAVKQACTETGVNYNNQFKRVQKEFILQGKCKLVKTKAADGKMRKMLCMKEMDFYQWVLNIRSDSNKLQKVQLEIYDILYKKFRGSITGMNNYSDN